MAEPFPSPESLAQSVEDAACAKASRPWPVVLGLAVPAGAFIALGFVFFLTSQVGAGAMPWGVGRVLGGLVFATGLALCVITGADLFTSATLTLMAKASGRLSWPALLWHWGVVYLGNAVGSLAIAALVLGAGLPKAASGGWGATLLLTAEAKCHHSFVEAFCLGVLCNLLVCLAVWLATAGRTVTDKIAGLILPITLFVACGSEHSVANMFLVPLALVVKAQGDLPSFGVTADQLTHLTWGDFLVGNLLPVTLGNVIGGGVLVGLLFWLTLRRG